MSLSLSVQGQCRIPKLPFRSSKQNPAAPSQGGRRRCRCCATDDLEFSQLLFGGPPETLRSISRARSASDAGVLRRKGRLKEQDRFIDFIVSMHQTHTSIEVMAKVENWVKEHRQDPHRSKLKRLVPSIGEMFTELPLLAAFHEYDRHFLLSRRRFVPPNFAEIRHILNIAQVHASAPQLRLLTFDADGTLYADGAHLEQDNRIIELLVELLARGVHVSIVTAAGYPGDPRMFEARIQGLLDAFASRQLPLEVTDRFSLLGGECNYLLKYDWAQQGLVFVPESEWKSREMLAWQQDDIDLVLVQAQGVLEDAAAALKLPCKTIRKERAVGVVPLASTVYEVLEDLALTVRNQLVAMPVPFCAFNGGADVFVDIGNKSLGLHALMKYIGTQSEQTVHVGDRFTLSGNDSATRDCCPILWVASPEETAFFVDMLLDDIEQNMDMQYIE